MTEHEMDAGMVGANIVCAARVMRGTHREVSNLLGWLDEALGGRGWSPLHVSSTNWVGLAMNGAQIGKPENWMATTLARGYMPAGAPDEPCDRALIIEIDLAPEGVTVPVLAALAISLAKPLTSRQFWPAWWTWGEGGTWRVARSDGIVELDAAALARVVSGASGEARGLIVPLCELDRRSVEARILDPALDLFIPPLA